MNRARKPAVFRLDDPGIVVTPSEEPRSIAQYPPPLAGEGRVGAATPEIISFHRARRLLTRRAQKQAPLPRLAQGQGVPRSVLDHSG